MKNHVTAPRKLFLCMAIGLAGVAPQANAADWEWMVAPYVWLPTVSTDLERTVPPEGGISSDISFDDILDKGDGAFLMHAEGQGDQFGILTDFIYLGLSDEHQFERFDTETDFDARVFELAGVWSPGEERYQGFEVIAGLRYIDVDVNAVFDPINPAFNTSSLEGGDTFYDFMLGVRWAGELSDRWGLSLRGDGSTGGTEGTWNFEGLLSYKTNSGAWFGGYRFLSVEYGDDNDDQNVKLNLSGPVFGYAFKF
jgi:hypothetical protein